MLGQSLCRQAAASNRSSSVCVKSKRGSIQISKIGTGGASCGGPRSIQLASEVEGIRTMAFLSTWLSPEALATYKGMSELPVLAITAEDDGETAQNPRDRKAGEVDRIGEANECAESSSSSRFWWLFAFGGRKIEWRGKRYRVHRGFRASGKPAIGPGREHGAFGCVGFSRSD